VQRDGPLSAEERIVRRERRGGSRRRALLIAAVLLAAALTLVLLTKGGSSPHREAVGSTQTTGAAVATTTTSKAHHKSKGKPAAKATPPAETSVTVLNGTETTGLAHRISASLQQSGYSQAAAVGGRPPGANEVTVVEYATGHQADAEGVAHTLSVSHVQPEEQAVAVLAGTASVVVIVGVDKAKA
jgi:hypothetical protein